MRRALLIAWVSCLVATNQAGLINLCDLAKVLPQEGMDGFEGCSLRDYKEFIGELLKKAVEGREEDTSTKLTTELEREPSGKQGNSLSASLRLLIKLLREQQKTKVPKEEQDTDQWKNENNVNKRREAKGEQEEQESRELTEELPEYGYNKKLIVTIPVIVVTIIFTVMFCFIAIHCRRPSSKGSKEGSSRGFFSILWHKRCSAEHMMKGCSPCGRPPLWLRDLHRPLSATCIENMAQKLHDRDSPVEDELFYKM